DDLPDVEARGDRPGPPRLWAAERDPWEEPHLRSLLRELAHHRTPGATGPAGFGIDEALRRIRQPDAEGLSLLPRHFRLRIQKLLCSHFGEERHVQVDACLFKAPRPTSAGASGRLSNHAPRSRIPECP